MGEVNVLQKKPKIYETRSIECADLKKDNITQNKGICVEIFQSLCCFIPFYNPQLITKKFLDNYHVCTQAGSGCVNIG